MQHLLERMDCISIVMTEHSEPDFESPRGQRLDRASFVSALSSGGVPHLHVEQTGQELLQMFENHRRYC